MWGLVLPSSAAPTHAARLLVLVLGMLERLILLSAHEMAFPHGDVLGLDIVKKGAPPCLLDVRGRTGTPSCEERLCAEPPDGLDLRLADTAVHCCRALNVRVCQGVALAYEDGRARDERRAHCRGRRLEEGAAVLEGRDEEVLRCQYENNMLDLRIPQRDHRSRRTAAPGGS